MKKLIYIAAILVAAISATAQGTINVNNRITGTLDAPVFDVGGTVRLSGTGFFAQLYAGPAGAGDGALVAVGTPINFRTGNAAGYVVVTGLDTTIPSVAPGAKAQVQLRAWDAAFPTFAAAVAGGGKNGGSNSFLSQNLGGPDAAGGPPALAATLVGLQSFSLVPEPSTIALGALGIGALLFRRRK